MEIRLDRKRALVSGAGKGIGRKISKKLVECGAETFALSRTKEDLDSLKEEVPSIHVIQLDLRDWDKTREAIGNIGPIDLLVNNAGVLVTESCLETSKEDLDRSIDINFKAAFNVAQILVNSGPRLGEVWPKRPGTFPFAATYDKRPSTYIVATIVTRNKCSIGITVYETKSKLIQVNPGVVWTSMALTNQTVVKNRSVIAERTPLGHFVEPDDVADLVVFLLSDRSSMVTGECIKLDGGFTLT